MQLLFYLSKNINNVLMGSILIYSRRSSVAKKSSKLSEREKRFGWRLVRESGPGVRKLTFTELFPCSE